MIFSSGVDQSSIINAHCDFLVGINFLLSFFITVISHFFWHHLHKINSLTIINRINKSNIKQQFNDFFLNNFTHLDSNIGVVHEFWNLFPTKSYENKNKDFYLKYDKFYKQKLSYTCFSTSNVKFLCSSVKLEAKIMGSFPFSFKKP